MLGIARIFRKVYCHSKSIENCPYRYIICTLNGQISTNLSVFLVFREATSEENKRLHCLLLHIGSVECLAGVYSTEVVFEDVQGSIVLSQKEKVTVLTAQSRQAANAPMHIQ